MVDAAKAKQKTIHIQETKKTCHIYGKMNQEYIMRRVWKKMENSPKINLATVLQSDEKLN